MTLPNDERPLSDDPVDWTVWAREAVTHERWETALERWAHCIDKFGARPHWLAQKANALRRLDRIAEAQALYETLARDHPNRSVGLDGLAWTAFRKGDFSQALALFTQCLENYPDDPPRAWTRMRAGLLLQLGDPAQSEALYLRLMKEEPGNREDKAGWVRAATEICRTAGDDRERREELAKYVLEEIVSGGDGDARNTALHLLHSMGAWDDAVRLLSQMLCDAQTLKEMAVCFQFIPLHFERGSRGAPWSQLLTRVRSIVIARERADWRAALDLELRLLLALERFADFVAKFDSERVQLEDTAQFSELKCVRDRLAKPRGEVFAEAKIFGIGLFRTGTTSLNQALTILGIDSVHWTNPLTHQLISEIDMYMFGAATDSSVSQDFEKLYYQYPNARFILTQRPIDAWMESIRAHHRRHTWSQDMDGLRVAFDQRQCQHMFSHAAVEFGLYINGRDFAQSYRLFERRVRHFFSDKPQGKLLELDLFAGQGWPQLCRFLDRPIPDVAFPRLNAAPP